MNGYLFPASRATGASSVVTADRGVPQFAKIVAVASALPERSVVNQEIIDAHGHGVTATAMRQIVGVSERRVAEQGVADSDLLAAAARRCLEQAELEPRELSKLIVTKFLGDRLLPMTASVLQRKLGCDVAIQAYDIDGGTHAFLQALDAAECCIGTGDGPVLISSGGVINCLISKHDPHVAFTYGDGAAAVLMKPTSERHVLSTYFYSNHQFADSVSGFALHEDLLRRAHDPLQYPRLHELYRPKDWRSSKAFVLEAVQQTVDNLTKDAGISRTDVNLYLVSATHHRLWLAILDQLGITATDTVSVLPNLGNTMSAMLPMGLDLALRSGRVGPGNLVMLLSVGEGASGGGMLVRL